MADYCDEVMIVWDNEHIRRVTNCRKSAAERVAVRRKPKLVNGSTLCSPEENRRASKSNRVFMMEGLDTHYKREQVTKHNTHKGAPRAWGEKRVASFGVYAIQAAFGRRRRVAEPEERLGSDKMRSRLD